MYGEKFSEKASSSSRLWKSASYDRAEGTILPCGLVLYTRKIDFPKCAASKILFMTDFHLRYGMTKCIPRGPSWRGTQWIIRAVSEAIEAAAPDIFIFGGDAVSESAMTSDFFSVLKNNIPSSILRIAVPGNWDKRRRHWMPHSFWRENYEAVGFHYLDNENLTFDNFRFYGMDDFKLGKSIYRPCPEKDSGKFNCVITHNPDGVTKAMTENDISKTNLILCGHTHGGQFRIPFFGAIKTSSRHWKRFERGLYKTETGTEMIVSGGLGATWLPVRINCPPECTVVEFV